MIIQYLNKYLLIALTLNDLSLTTNVSDAQNSMGDVNGNNGIVTQGQVGNNYIIIQHPPPSVAIIGTEPIVHNGDATYTWTLRFRLSTDFAANSVLVAIKKEDIVVTNSDHMPFWLGPVGGGVIESTSWANDNYYVNRTRTPISGEYIIRAKVRSPDSKPAIYIGVNQ